MKALALDIDRTDNYTPRPAVESIRRINVILATGGLLPLRWQI
ncbi:MAG: hypothetical protein PHD13_03195 [Methanocellales archaeon]|nr:hypothetical protein [Methanocellales archaeon]MDD3291594.1 hypothetical protein [Methanocellales archaeon]MDD5235163.1 hypothetical protein [Methanocellales archaeon]MDD5485377.1 hypothetical protein [Methanocellales archaeon]